jgi:hypothetical protein
MERSLRMVGFEITKPRTTLTALTLSMVMLLSAYTCTPAQVQNWMDILAKDLPIMVQMGLTIASLTGVLGVKEAPEVDAAITALGNEASTDLKLAQAAYDEYKATPTETNKQKVASIFQTIRDKLPELLIAAHVKNPDLLQRLTSGIGLITGMASTILEMLTPALGAKKGVTRTLPSPDALKQQWDTLVGVPLAEAHQ